jgi:NhaP-type Na+/H+ or K+/H+ antiporter
VLLLAAVYDYRRYVFSRAAHAEALPAAGVEREENPALTVLCIVVVLAAMAPLAMDVWRRETWGGIIFMAVIMAILAWGGGVEIAKATRRINREAVLDVLLAVLFTSACVAALVAIVWYMLSR